MTRAALLLVVLAVSGCGGGGAEQTAGPQLPHALAQRWAQRAAAIAEAHPCAAHRRAVALRADVIRAVNRHEVPQSLLEPLTSKVNALAAHTACAPLQSEAQGLAAWFRNPSG